VHIGSPGGDTPGLRKARGAFFTPHELCDHMAGWAIRDPADRVLEPSCGEAAFLLAAGRRLSHLGAAGGGHLHGIEVHGPSARAAKKLLAERGYAARIEAGDFFARTPHARYEAVIGNPPYVRYQDFAGEARSRARAAALRGGVRLSALASSWAAFTVHAALFLVPDGRLALVLPAELLSTNYAGEVRGFLMRRFARVRLVMFAERVFPRVQEEVVLLLAEGEGPADHCELHQVSDLRALARQARVSSWQPVDPEGKWTPALLDPGALGVYRDLQGDRRFATLSGWGETTLGAVTGSNAFFALSDADVAQHGLLPADLVPISPPGSRHLRRLTLTRHDWDELRRRGRRAWLFRPGGRPSAAARRYIAQGEAQGVDQAYKCRVRAPWWRTPLGPPPDLFVTYMNADAPRLAINAAGAHHLNSVHGLYLHPQVGRDRAALLPLAALNSMTLLGAETVGRAYGGGILKLEPREADLLPVPAPALIAGLADRLDALRAPVDGALADGDLMGAARLVDPVVLQEGLGLPPAACAVLRDARDALAARRRARGRAGGPAAA
jgi:adenine-specific DNA-methyltransferase